LLVKLVPTPEHHAALLRTLAAVNAARTASAAVAFEQHLANTIELQKLVYYDIRQRVGLSSQMAIRAIAKVAEAYTRDKPIKPSVRPHGAMVYDERIANCPTADRVSLLTLDGRAARAACGVRRAACWCPSASAPMLMLRACCSADVGKLTCSPASAPTRASWR
jgi:predicted transposase